jgi:aminocarboxymuconate-semialdehyde decarboxylase
MPSRRDFIRGLAGTTAGMFVARGGLAEAFAQAPQAGAAKRREVIIAGRRVKVIDLHAHAGIPEVAEVLKGTPFARYAQGGGRLGTDRIVEMDRRGIDIQVLDMNVFWWYGADRDLATKIVEIHNKGLAAWCAAHSDRFVALTSPALQFPDLAVQQLEHAVKDLNMRGAAVGGHVAGEPISLPKYDPFWAKAQELGVMVFMHPTDAANVVTEDSLKVRGDLVNIVGMPLETTVFLTHMIFDGTLDRFPGLKICAAHGGGYLPSYSGRTEAACEVRPNADCANKKKPSEYLKTQILVDSMVFSKEGIRHLVAEMGANQVVYGTDLPALSWPDSVDTILSAQITDAEKEAILGGNLAKLLKV